MSLAPRARPLLVALFLLSPLLARAQDLADLVEAIRKKHDVPALGGAVVTADKGVEAIAASGLREAGKDAAVTEDDLWHLGSDTKAMTATLYALFVDRGKAQWDLPLEKAFPDFAEQMNDHFKKVTVDQLMAHRSGIRSGWSPDERAALCDAKRSVSERRAEFARVLLSKSPREKPEDYVYSNSNFIVVGAVLEKIAGKPWEELMRTELFGPLGMKTAGFGPPGSAKGLDQPRGHQDTAQGRKSFHSDNPEGLGPAGTVHASLRDWAHFLRLHLTGSEGSLTLSKESLAHLHTPLSGKKYVCGWGTYEQPWSKGLALSHDGSNTMWYCRCTVFPGRGFAVMAVSNIGGGKLGHGGAACMELADELVRTRVPELAQQGGFGPTVEGRFGAWDADGDGELSAEEIDRVVLDPAVKGPEAAAIAAIKIAIRGGKWETGKVTKEALTDRGAKGRPDFERSFTAGLAKLARSRNLFEEGAPCLEAFHQGREGDCFFLAALGALIHRDAAGVKGMIVPKDDGGFTVKFGLKDVEVSPLTDAEILITSGTEGEGLWLSVFEKAAGRARNDALPEQKQVEEAVDSISHGGTSLWSIRLLTGKETAFYRVRAKGKSDAAPTDGEAKEVLPKLRELFPRVLDAKKLLCAGTPKTVAVPGVTPRHVYAILSYDAGADTLEMWNPHGNRFTPKGAPGLANGYETKSGRFTIPLSDFVRIFAGGGYEE